MLGGKGTQEGDILAQGETLSSKWLSLEFLFMLLWGHFSLRQKPRRQMRYDSNRTIAATLLWQIYCSWWEDNVSEGSFGPPFLVSSSEEESE